MPSKAIVNLDNLTDEHLWGLHYEVQNENARTERLNETIKRYNDSRPVHLPERKFLPTVTVQEYADRLASERFNLVYLGAPKPKEE